MNRIRSSGNFSILYFVLMFLCLVMIFATLWIRSNVIAVEYKLSSLEDKKKNLLKERKILLAEKASLTSFAKLEGREGHLLVFPDRKKVVYIVGSPESMAKTTSFVKKQ